MNIDNVEDCFFTRYSLCSRDGVALESKATPPPALMLFK